MKCSGCDKEYIGETSNLRARVQVHKRQIFDPHLRHLYVCRHIAHCAVGKETPFKIIPFSSLKRYDKHFCEETKHHFIRKFQTELNQDI